MLAEILKQPTGPDAARLALLIELSRYKGTDLAAKAVVSSYQQNNSANPVTAQPVQARQQNGPSQSADGRPNPATTTTTTAQPATAAPGRLLPMLIGPLAQSAAAIKAMVAAQAAPQGPQANLPAPPADMSDSPHDSAKPEGKPPKAPYARLSRKRAAQQRKLRQMPARQIRHGLRTPRCALHFSIGTP